MKKLAFGTLMIAGLLAACGGDDGVTPLPDAPPGDAQGACNPLGAPGQQGCLAGQKCTWITIQETPEALGKLGCVADGTVALNGTCAFGDPGETTGFDDCQAGLYCISGTCRDVCGFDGSTAAACATGFNCTVYSDTFANGTDEPVAGVCNPGCDPLTQLKTGTTENCGANMGCYLLARTTGTTAVCADAGDVAHNVDISGQAFANSCVPGAQPRSKDAVSQTVQCGGLCKMVNITSTMNNDTVTEGGQVTASTTDKDNCQATWSANPVTDTATGESCRYFWAREPFDGITPYSNTVGWCFKHPLFDYDSNGDMTADADFPRCSTLTTGDTVLPIGNPPHNDAVYFWCNELPAMLQGAVKNIKSMHARNEPKLDKLVDHWRHQ